jgi:uncharacterized membrane protein
MKSKAAIAGHPIHPMLVAVPAGLFVWTLVADVVYLATDKDQTWYDIALWSGLAAWISAVVAALPGFVDLVTVVLKSDARGIAVAHMLLNLTAVALFAVATAFMWNEGALSGSDLTIVLVLHAIGVGIVSLSGWLGGEMVFRHHIGMVPDTAELERQEHMVHDSRGATRRI